MKRTCPDCRKDYDTQHYYKCPYCGHKPIDMEVIFGVIVLSLAGLVMMWYVNSP